MLGKKQVFEVKLALIIETYLSNKFNHKMAFKTSGGACIVLVEKNSEKKTEKNLVDDLAFKKLILESNNNEVSLSSCIYCYSNQQGSHINKSILVGVSRSSRNMIPRCRIYMSTKLVLLDKYLHT